MIGLAWLLGSPAVLLARPPPALTDWCPRPTPGSAVLAPHELHARAGILKAELTLRNYRAADGTVRYCYLSDGSPSPALRLHPGDLLELRLKNDLVPLDLTSAVAMPGMTMSNTGGSRPDPCSGRIPNATSTNLHFHGLTVPAVCHQDDVLKTTIQPTDSAFVYRFRVPADQPPGLYWYHPHMHGFSSRQVLGGASGPLIIEGIESAVAEVAGLPERVLVIRDQELSNPDAQPSRSEPVTPPTLLERDGDASNNGTGFGKPAKDLSINFVPVPYPDYPPAVLEMKPGSRELWRVLNASAVTYLNLALIFGNKAQQIGLVAIDGVPMNASGRSRTVTWVDHIGVPPGGRIEFIVTGPSSKMPALFVTRAVDTGQGGENDPNRALARIVTTSDAAEPHVLPAYQAPLPTSALPWLGDVAPVRVRRLYFSEKLEDPKDPNSATQFYITVEGQTPKSYDPTDGPSIVARQGDVEDWIIENRTTELHTFHIHQLHFMLTEWNGAPVNEPFLRDTINVPYFNARMLQYPSVKIRMDFRAASTIGTFVYHCHLLEHEDAGMMASIRVEPQATRSAAPDRISQ